MIRATDWCDGWNCINPADCWKKHEAEAQQLFSSGVCTQPSSVHSFLGIICQTGILVRLYKHLTGMADTSVLDDGAHEAGPSTSARGAGDTAQSDDRSSSPADQVIPLFDIINSCVESDPALQDVMPPRCRSPSKACLLSDSWPELYWLPSDFSIDF